MLPQRVMVGDAAYDQMGVRAGIVVGSRHPFRTLVRVTNLANGRTTVVRINDRRPFVVKDRVIDLSQAAAQELQFSGLVTVALEAVSATNSPLAKADALSTRE